MVVNIESTSNAVYKQIKKLSTHSGRKKSGEFIIEGLRIVKDAIKNNAPIEYIVLCESQKDIPLDNSINKYIFSDKLYNELKFTVNSQGVLAVVKFSENTTSDIFKQHNSFKKIVYLDSIQDPGNMGTIIRTCDAMGIDAVVIGDGCVDVYNPKVVRSTMSSIFNVPLFFEDNAEDTFETFIKSNYNIVGTFLNAQTYSYDADLKNNCVIVLGNEANGINSKIEDYCNIKIKIPMSGNAESLNVSVACAMILYEQYMQNIHI